MATTLSEITEIEDDKEKADALVKHTDGWLRLVQGILPHSDKAPDPAMLAANEFVISMAQVEATLAVALYLKALLEKDDSPDKETL